MMIGMSIRKKPLELRWDVQEGIAYTYINGVRGTLNYRDANALVQCAKNIPPGGRYLETGSRVLWYGSHFT